jgi:tellurium resistance protein TerD
MAVNLSKGGKISLAKVAADAGISTGLTKIVVGLGWDVNRYSGGGTFDLDACAFLTGANGKVREDADFVFYGSAKQNAEGKKCDSAESVVHQGDNRDGEGEGDDEQIIIDLTKVPAEVQKISITVTIDQALERNQNFGMVENAFIHIVDVETGTELIRYDLTEDFSIETAIVVAELYRNNGEWKFNAIGAGFSGGLKALCANFGIDAE